MSACEGKAAFRDEDAAARARDRHDLNPERYTVYQCGNCNLWHYGYSYKAPRLGQKQRRSRGRRHTARATETKMGKALRDAGWVAGEGRPDLGDHRPDDQWEVT